MDDLELTPEEEAELSREPNGDEYLDPVEKRQIELTEKLIEVTVHLSQQLEQLSKIMAADRIVVPQRDKSGRMTHGISKIQG